MSNPNFITVPVEFQSAKPEQGEVVPVAHVGEKVPYSPRVSNIELKMTPERTAALLAEKEEQARMVQAAGDSVADALAAADAAKHEQMQ